jgi:hypothetical protein
MSREPSGTESGELAGRQKIILAVTLALVCVAAVGYAAWPFLPRSDLHEEFLCEKCGLKRLAVSRTVLWVRTSRSEKTEPTPVSRAFAQIDAQPCEHVWNRSRFAFHNSREAGYGGAGLLRLLSKDHALAAELAAIGSRDASLAHEIWASLYRATWRLEDPRARLVDDWWSEGADRKPLGAWYAAHRSQFAP